MYLMAYIYIYSVPLRCAFILEMDPYDNSHVTVSFRAPSTEGDKVGCCQGQRVISFRTKASVKLSSLTFYFESLTFC